ncbi:Hint domain-containing protein [Nocardiopsis suaedae]|uniref:Hint domain-containing protein n=1 Tax=Nocardiopsis suaedae TaxID=3018444 RepID=A0ABT4TV33_9ACTN|nr:Hint domain-containing protein [Nocardiopsis suaedae]MDA2808543.1 Hint domain-containing protein [Nocardiopsis suaedae]
MLLRIHDPDRGASFVEYSAVIVVCGAIIASLVGVGMTDTGQEVRTGIENAYEQAFGGQGSGDEGGSQSADGSDGDSGDGGAGDDGGGDAGEDKDFLDHVGGFFSGLGGGIADDVTGIGDIFTQNPVDTVTDAINGIKEDPLSLILSPETRDAWNNGDYGEAIGGGTWDIGSWFIPGPGWASKLGKLGRLGGRADAPDAPDGNGNGNGGSNGDGGDKPDDDQQADGDKDDENDNDGATCAANSFVPGTGVLMADGSTVPIESVEAGDEVWAFDPTTGEEGPREVTAAIVGEGEKTLVDITVVNEQGTVATLSATGGHPFWAPEQAEWVDAVDVGSGTMLRTPSGEWLEVAEHQTRRVEGQRVYNLSVNGISTFYAGNARGLVLTHNQSGYDCGEDVDDTLDAIDQEHGADVAQGAEHMLDELAAGKSNHKLAGIDTLEGLGSYLAGRRGRSTHTDTNTGNRVSYDNSVQDADGNGVIIIESEYSIHAFHMSKEDFDKRVQNDRYRED